MQRRHLHLFDVHHDFIFSGRISTVAESACSKPAGKHGAHDSGQHAVDHCYLIVLIGGKISAVKFIRSLVAVVRDFRIQLVDLRIKRLAVSSFLFTILTNLPASTRI